MWSLFWFCLLMCQGFVVGFGFLVFDCCFYGKKVESFGGVVSESKGL